MRRGFGLFAALALTILTSLVFGLAQARADGGTTSSRCAPTGMEQIWTDQGYYSLGATFHIGGSGFASACDLTYLVPPPPGVIGPYSIDARGLDGAVIASVAAGPIGLHGTATAQNGGPNSPATLVINKPSGTLPGDVLIAQVVGNGGNTGTIGAPAGWTLIGSKNDSSDNVGQAIYRKVATGSEPSSYTWTTTTPVTVFARAAGGIAAYSGVDTSSPVDSTAGTPNNSDTYSAPAVTTTVANDKIVNFYGVDVKTSISTSPGTPTATQVFCVTTTASGCSLEESESGGPSAKAQDWTQASAGPGTARTATGSNTAWVANTVALMPDTTNPTGSLNINSGAAVTNTTSVTLNLSASDGGGIVRYRVANGSDCSAASLVSVTQTTSYSADAGFNLSSGDGLKTVCVQYQDAAGNSSTFTDTITLDATGPVVSVTKVNGSTVSFPFSTNANIASVGGACGTATGDNATVSVTLGGNPAVPASTTCSAGSWTLTLTTPISSPEGNYVFAAAQSDSFGNTGTSGNKTVTLDKTPPVVTLTQENGATRTFPYTTNANITSVGGTCTTGDGNVSVTVNSSATTPSSVACSAGSWTLTLTTPISSPDGNYDFVASQTDSAGNPGGSGTKLVVLDETAPVVTLDKLNGSSVSFPVSTTSNINSVGGACTTGEGNVSVTLGGSPTTPASAACSAGSWTLTLTTPLSAENTYVFAGAQTDSVGNTGSSGNKTVVIDRTAPAVTLTRENGVTRAFPYTTNADIASVGGSCTTGDGNVSVTVNSSPTAPAGATCSAGSWTLTLTTPISSPDGNYVFAASQTDAAGNPGSSGNKTVTLDKTAPAIAIATVTDPVLSGNETNTSADGTTEVGAGVEVTATDGSTTVGPFTALVDGSGNWSVGGMDVSTLADGTITYEATATDAVGNSASDTKDATKDAATTVAITGYSDPVSFFGQTHVYVAGTAEDGDTIQLTVSDGNPAHDLTDSTTADSSDPNWLFLELDLSGLDDGPITYSVVATDAVGNTATDSKAGTKDTDTTTFVSIGSFTNPVTHANVGSVSVSGTAEVGDSLSLKVTDGNPATPDVTGSTTADSSGDWSFAGLDLSGLDDGGIGYVVVAGDGSGNHAGAAAGAFKDTTTAVSITSVTDPVTVVNQTTAAVSGSSQMGKTIDLTVSDGNPAHNVTDSTSADGSGDWSFSGLDLSGLDDGTITYSVLATDFFGNTAADTKSATKVIAADGDGTITATPAVARYASSGNTITFIYTTAAGGISNGALTIDVPAGWSAPSTSGLDNGFTKSNVGAVSVLGRTITVSGLNRTGGQPVVVIYGAKANGGGGATAPSSSGSATWQTQEKSVVGGTLTNLSSQPEIDVLSADGSGSIDVDPASVIQGSTGNTLSFTYTATAGGMSNGSVQLVVPPGWSAPSINPGTAGYTASTGIVSAASRTITVKGVTLAEGGTLTVTYGSTTLSSPGATAPSTAGVTTWTARQRSSSDGAFTSLTSPTVDVTSEVLDHFKITAAGGGTIAAQQRGVPFSVKITAQDVHDHTVTAFNGTVDVSSNRTCSSGCTTTASFANGVLSSQSLTLTQGGTGSTITATQTGGGIGTSSNTFTVYSADGDGSVTASPTVVRNGSSGNTIAVTYAVAAGGISNGTLTFAVPAGWSPPSTTGLDNGFTKSNAGTVTTLGQTITVSGLNRTEGQTVVVNYGAKSSGGSGATAPATGATSTWPVKEQSVSSGSLQNVTPSPSISVLSADGSGAVDASTSSVVHSSTGNTITFTYTAAAGGMNNGSVSVTVPSGWSAPSSMASSAGYTTAAGGAPISISNRTITVNGVTLAQGQTMTITYGSTVGGGLGATATSTPGSQEWTSKQRSTSSATLTPVTPQPSINVS